MKRITALLLCFMLVCSFSTVAYAQTLPEAETKGEAVISASVPDSHKITVSSEGAAVFLNGTEAKVFDVERLSEPVVLIRAESGKEIRQVLLNGEDITAQIKGGYYAFSPVFEDKELRVITEDTSTVPQSKTYVVKGTVERNGEPVENITLELRSTLKTDLTDQDGRFLFNGVECGKHSLTALENGKVVGYTEFILTEGEQTEFNLQDNGLYTVTVNENEIGIDLTLNLEEDGKITINDIKDSTSAKPDEPDDPKDEGYDIEGTVTDENGDPVPGVTVDIGGHTGTTDEDGEFKIEDIPPGTYPVVITDEDGNVIGTGEITIGEPGGGDFTVTTDEDGNPVITPGEDTEDIGLTIEVGGDGGITIGDVTDETGKPDRPDQPDDPKDEGYDVEGTVTDENGDPVPGVTVDIGGHTGTTDEDGEFKIEDIPPGTYPVVITDEDGNVIGTGEITIGEPGDGDFTVTTGEDGNPIITPGKDTDKIGMTLVMEEDGTITIKDIKDNTPAKPDKPHKPDKPSDPAKPGPGGNVPGTGDNSRPWLWLVLMLASCGGLVIAILYGRRKQNSSD